MKRTNWIKLLILFVMIVFLTSAGCGGGGGGNDAANEPTHKPANELLAKIVQPGSDRLTVDVSEPIDFNSMVSGGEGDNITYKWDWGDSTTATEENPSHAYLKAGNYTVTLTVSNAEGLEQTDSMQIRVLDGVFTNDLGMTFNEIPSGTFTMGSPPDELGRINPGGEIQHDVTLTRSFYMQTTEVTQGQWRAVMGSNPAYFKSCGDNCPIESVDWKDVHDFIVKMNSQGDGAYRLPTEAEWEYAARAGRTTAFANGDITLPNGLDPNLNEIGWFDRNSKKMPHPVAQKDPNDWGLYDMHGNVFEWCLDTINYESSNESVTDPLETDAIQRSIRGGYYNAPAEQCRAAGRYQSTEWIKDRRKGFRLVLEPKSTAPKVSITKPAGNSIFQHGETIEFAGSVKDEDGEIITLTWHFGDGNENNYLNNLYAYDNAGYFVVTLTAEDEDGVIGSDTIKLEIKGDPAPEGDFTNSLGMTFIRVSSGSFMQGSPYDEEGRYSTEDEHKVNLSNPYYIQTTEITQGQWYEVMGTLPFGNLFCGMDCPAENISWDEIQDFIAEMNKLGEGRYRLPTESEWEYAANGGSATAFGNGDIHTQSDGYDKVLDSMGWYKYNSGDTLHPVAQKEPNNWGLYDMHGNVQEWCQDWFGPYPPGEYGNYSGPSYGKLKVLRGGGYVSPSWACRSAFRSRLTPDEDYWDIGFRLVLSIE